MPTRSAPGSQGDAPPEKLTEARIKALAYEGKPAIVRDAKVTGLLVEVNKT